MKKVLVLFVLLAAAVYVASWFWAGDEVAAAAARPWPDGLGTLAAFADRYPPLHENEAARKLTRVSRSLAQGIDSVSLDLVSARVPISLSDRSHFCGSYSCRREPSPRLVRASGRRLTRRLHRTRTAAFLHREFYTSSRSGSRR